MLGGRHKQQKAISGYTIIEVLIVLAVSGLMFVIAANFINGKQQKTSFTEGVNEMASRIQDSIEQVTDGNYSDIPFSCSPAGAGLAIGTSGSPANSSQGTNPSCVFIGKFLHFNVSGGPTNYEVFSLAALRSSTTLGADVTPVVGGSVDLTQQQTIPQRLDAKWVRINGNSTSPYNGTVVQGFGFAQSQGSLESNGSYSNGAQTVQLVSSTNLAAGADESGAVSQLTGNVSAVNNAALCLSDGTRYAIIFIGDTANGGDQLGVNVKMLGTQTC